MKKIILITALLAISGACSGGHHEQGHRQHSSYAGQEKRQIKALADEDVAALTNGEGMGLAKAAELNGFPGPKHVLENAAGIALTAEQKIEVQKLFDTMKARAVALGRQIVEGEKELDALFREGRVDEPALEEKTRAIAALQGDLRRAHLAAHLEMKKLLSPEQIEKYNRLRGYRN